MKFNEKNLMDSVLGKKAPTAKGDGPGELSEDVQSLLGVTAQRPAVVVAEMPPEPLPDPALAEPVPTPTPTPAAPAAKSLSVERRAKPQEVSAPPTPEAEPPPAIDEFAQWESQVNDQLNTRYRRSTDKYLGEERRAQSEPQPLSAAALPEFPDLSVVVYEPVAIVRGSIVELFENFTIPVIEPPDYDAFKIALEQSSIKKAFTVAILGDEGDVEINASRVQELRSEHPDKPLVFLSTMDLSQPRRRILHSGASYFIQKPDLDSPNLGALQIIKKRFLDDLLLFVSECHARHIAVYNALADIE